MTRHGAAHRSVGESGLARPSGQAEPKPAGHTDIPLVERVVHAIESLGSAFIGAPQNGRLRRALGSGDLSPDDFARQLIRVVYRVLFVIIAEDRGLLHPPEADASARERYAAEFSMRRLQKSGVAGRHAGPADISRREGVVTGSLSRPGGNPELALPGLCSFLWSCSSTPDLPGRAEEGEPLVVGDDEWLSVLRSLHAPGEPVPEPAQLGSVYESLLELSPRVDLGAGTLVLRAESGSERRASGSYYTPDGLVQHILDTALEPVIRDRLSAAAADARAKESALLGIVVCDPAAGSGHFLIGAARRLADRLAHVRTSNPTPHDCQLALRDVIGRCIHGVDLDPMAAELCRIGLWYEMREPGASFSALNERIKVGNALLGTSPELMAEVAPVSPERARLAADAWCASFVWPAGDEVPGSEFASSPSAMPDAIFDELLNDPAAVPPRCVGVIQRLAEEHRFFHWHLEFPEIFGEAGRAEPGFDVVLGNPPFLNQLESATAARRGPAAIMQATTGGAVRGYTDAAAAFLLLAARLCRPSGRLSLVQPLSFLAARDAGPVRSSLLDDAALTHLWIGAERVFAGASVLTCAPTLHRAGPRVGVLARHGSALFSPLPTLPMNADELRAQETWAPLAAAALGIPEFEFDAGGVVGDRAGATADFRDQYYGLAGFLVEDADTAHRCDSIEGTHPPIVTAGLIDLASCRWGRAGTRIHKRAWDAPRIDRERMVAEGTLAGWIEARLVPKIILATQTRVLEVFVDERGRFVPSLPLITIRPKLADDLWRVAAAVASPVSTAIAMQRYSGTALSAQAIKLSAKQALSLPTPADEHSWDVACESLRGAHTAGDERTRRARLESFAEQSTAAYRVPQDQAAELVAWWVGRLK